MLEWPKVKVSKTGPPDLEISASSQIPRPGPRTPLIKCPSPLWKKQGFSASAKKKQLIKQPSSYHHDRYYRCLNPYLWSLNPHVSPCLVAQPTNFSWSSILRCPSVHHRAVRIRREAKGHLEIAAPYTILYIYIRNMKKERDIWINMFTTYNTYIYTHICIMDDNVYVYDDMRFLQTNY